MRDFWWQKKHRTEMFFQWILLNFHHVLFIMNNRKILAVFTGANLLMGMLFYAVFLHNPPLSVTSSSFIVNLIIAISLYYISYALYRKSRELDNSDKDMTE